MSEVTPTYVIDDVPLETLVAKIRQGKESLGVLQAALRRKLGKYNSLAGTDTATPIIRRRKRVPVLITNPETGETLTYRGGRRPEWLTTDMLEAAKREQASDPSNADG